MTIIVPREEAGKFWKSFSSNELLLPQCVIDHICAPGEDVYDSGNPPFCQRAKTRQWLTESSGSIISYVYKGIGDYYTEAFCAAEKRGGIADLTSKVTAKMISEAACAGDGEKARVLGALKKSVEQKKKNTVCCVYCPHMPLSWSKKVFTKVVTLLKERYGVSEFLVSDEVWNAAYIGMLKNILGDDTEVKITLLTGFSEITEEERKLHEAVTAGMCDAVVNTPYAGNNIDAGLNLLKCMLHRSDFCICDVIDSENEDTIRYLMAEAEGIKVFDIAKGTGDR